MTAANPTANVIELRSHRPQRDFEQALERELQLAQLEYDFWRRVWEADPCPQTQLRRFRALCRHAEALADVRGRP
jgi:hypothetical protein